MTPDELREQTIAEDQRNKHRGERAAAIINDPAYRDGFAVVANRLRHLMESGSDEVTLKAKASLGILGDVQRWLEQAIRDGQTAAINIDFAEKQKKAEAAEKARRARR